MTGPSQSFVHLLRSAHESRRPLALPVAHDALTARAVEQTGFPACAVGGSAIAAFQFGLPDLGLVSLGEYRDAVARIAAAVDVPLLVDGEDGFGDVKQLTRTTRAFAAMGIGALAIEDLVMPQQTAARPRLLPASDAAAKIAAAVSARGAAPMRIIARTDAPHAGSMDDALARVALFEAAGADAILVPGVPTIEGFRQVAEATRLPLIAVALPGTPLPQLGIEEYGALGYAAVLYPTLFGAAFVAALPDALDTLEFHDKPQAKLSMETLTKLDQWKQVDAAARGTPR